MNEQEGLSHAKKTGDDKKLQMVASRRKKLDDRMGLERNAKGHRLQINRSAASELLLSALLILLVRSEPRLGRDYYQNHQIHLAPLCSTIADRAALSTSFRHQSS